MMNDPKKDELQEEELEQVAGGGQIADISAVGDDDADLDGQIGTI